MAESSSSAAVTLADSLDRAWIGLRHTATAPLRTLDALGEQLSFYVRALVWIPRTLLRYKREVLRLLSQVVFGTGALAVIGGTVGVIAVLCFFTGTEVGLQGFAALDQLGIASLSGFISAYFNTREIAPLVAALALSATVGCGFTAQLGAMRISEEIDALEVMAVPSLPYLVASRIIAGFIAVIPLYVIGLLSSYMATYVILVFYYHQSSGIYSHYFHVFLPPGDVIWSFFKVLIFAVVIILSHCYYGYTAKGGPAGVGIAVGKAVRTSIVAVTLIDFFLSLAIWGIDHDRSAIGVSAMLMRAPDALRRRAAAIRLRLIGVTFLVVIAGLVALSIAIYNKAFTPVVEVSLRTDHTGNELMKASDVEERGVIVGSVKSVQSNGDGAVVKLALEPSQVRLIPANVTAQILPKTLFGQEYVSLEVPSNATGTIEAGAVIQQDRSIPSLETEDVLDDLLPLLQAVKPAQLDATLTAIATTLRGHGTQFGQLLVSLDSYLKQLNSSDGTGSTYTQRLVTDLTKLGKVADIYNAAAPAINSTLNDLQTSVKTVDSSKQQLSSLLSTISNTSGVVEGFLANNEQNLITVTGDSSKVFGLLAEYAPEYTCVFEGMSKVEDLAKGYITNDQMQLSIQIDNTNEGKYVPGNQPKLVSGYGPNCFGLPDDPQPTENGHFAMPPQYCSLNDGADFGPCASDSSAGATTSSDSDSAVGSPAENALVASLISGSYGGSPTAVPDIARTLAAPLLQGSVVTVK